jgi:MYXO-CTERM domain-containing protein
VTDQAEDPETSEERAPGRGLLRVPWPPAATDVTLVLISASYSALSVYGDADAPSKWVFTMVAAAGLLLRRR